VPLANLKAFIYELYLRADATLNEITSRIDRSRGNLDE
jgi:hypothetical protein